MANVVYAIRSMLCFGHSGVSYKRPDNTLTEHLRRAPKLGSTLKWQRMLMSGHIFQSASLMRLIWEAKKTKRGKKGKKPDIPAFLPFLPLFVFFASISTFFTRPDFMNVY